MEAEKNLSSRQTKNIRMRRSQRAALEKLLGELESKFLTNEQIKARLLLGRDDDDTSEIDIISRLDLIDAVRENLRTAIQFEDYRRANRYLVTLELLCEKFLS